MNDFARNLKQDSQIQAYIASQNPSTMYPVAVAISSNVPPVPPVPRIFNDSAILPDAEPRRRIQPTQVDLIHKTQYFHPKLHPYFHNDDYDPSMPQFERDYLDAYIIQRCYVNGKVIKLPNVNEQLILDLKRFQNNSLMHQTEDTSIAPWLMLEAMYMYMENVFIIQTSSIPNAGNGLFLRPNQSLPQGIFLPYPGAIQVNDEMTPQILLANDKLLCLRPSIYLNGSVSTVFPITGNTYPPYMSMANEKVCHNMFEINSGKIVDCGMVVFASPVSGSLTANKEVYVLYSSLTNSTLALIEESAHRTKIKLQVLIDLYEHMDDCVYGLQCYTPDFRANVK